MVSFGLVFLQMFRGKVRWLLALPFAIVVWPVYKWVAGAQVPYLVWVSVATILQLSITAMNGGLRDPPWPLLHVP